GGLFFFQAEDGIRDPLVTGVQTCALPISFTAEAGVEALDAPRNQDTLQNIRLWDWRALQDTLRQIQEIRTYYDFPDIDIDRYERSEERRVGKECRSRSSQSP